VSAEESGPTNGSDWRADFPILRLSERPSGVVALSGEVDVATAPLLEERLAGREGAIRLDMRDVTFLDSSGVRALLHLYQHCEGNGCTFQVEACSPQVERVLHIVGLYDILTEDGHGPPSQDGNGPH
jgi:anti-sigma B factor antagonist